MEQRRAERAQPTELLVQEARSTLNRFTGGGFSTRRRASNAARALAAIVTSDGRVE